MQRTTPVELQRNLLKIEFSGIRNCHANVPDMHCLLSAPKIFVRFSLLLAVSKIVALFIFPVAPILNLNLLFFFKFVVYSWPWGKESF